MSTFNSNSQLIVQTMQTGTAYTLGYPDTNTIVEFSNSAAVTVTVPLNSVIGFGIGTTISLRQYGAGQVSVAAASGVTILSRGSVFKLAGQYAEAMLTKRAANEWILSGDITS